jgi:hypothetical protein
MSLHGPSEKTPPHLAPLSVRCSGCVNCEGKMKPTPQSPFNLNLYSDEAGDRLDLKISKRKNNVRRKIAMIINHIVIVHLYSVVQYNIPNKI